MSNQSQPIRIRSKKLGALLRDARLKNKKTPEECAKIMQVSKLRYIDYEFGKISPSLPELEIFSYHLNITLDHFWGNTSISETATNIDDSDNERLLKLRHRIIGAKIRQARINADLSLEELSQQVDMPESQTEDYELGKAAVPLPELETLARSINRPIEDFIDDQGPIGRWEQQKRIQNYISELPSDLVEFLSKPINQPYLELAQRLSEMPTEKLRSIAESLLEITL